MSDTPDANVQAFWYSASSFDGQSITGTIDADGIDQAGQKLRAMQLQVVELKPTTHPRPAPLRGEDFQAFNQQLAQLAGAGLPVEEGLRLIAQDMRSGRLAQTIKQVVSDLEKGKSLPQAVEASRTRFPPLYSRLLDAGIRSGNLQGTLLNLGRHLTLVRQLRTAIWRTAAYPLMVLLAAFAVLVFVSFNILPQMEKTFLNFRTELPFITLWVIAIGDFLRSKMLWYVLAGLLIICLLAWQFLRATGKDSRVAARLGLIIPIFSPIIRRSLIARWCDAVNLGVEAGLDLPAAINLAGDIVNFPALRDDGQNLIASLSSGGNIAQNPRGQVLPLTVVRSIQLAVERSDLPATLVMFSQMYQERAQARLDALPGILAPILLSCVGGVIAIIIVAMLDPMLNLIEAISGLT